MGQSEFGVKGAGAVAVVPSELLTQLIAGFESGTAMVTAEAFVEGIRRAFYVSGFIAALGILTSLVRGRV